jgi:succinate dehydrogenase hydrophobic anchor subunit
MNLLIPDKSTKLLSYYHKSAKWMIPLSVSSYLSYHHGVAPFNNFVYIPTVLSLGYHSYFSTACIITDYIKPKNFAIASRVLNLKLHGLSTFGFIYFLCKKNKNFVS